MGALLRCYTHGMVCSFYHAEATVRILYITRWTPNILLAAPPIYTFLMLWPILWLGSVLLFEQEKTRSIGYDGFLRFLWLRSSAFASHGQSLHLSEVQACVLLSKEWSVGACSVCGNGILLKICVSQGIRMSFWRPGMTREFLGMGD